MVELPPEIWLHIIQFIPPPDLLKLYAVNRTFFDVAMDKKYRNVVFDHVNIHSIRRLDSLINPDIARRVRSFRFTPEIFGGRQLQDLEPNNSECQDSLNLSNTMKQCIESPSQRDSLDNTHTIGLDGEKLLKIVQYLTNIDAFSICGQVADNLPTPHINSFWPAISHNLHIISITAPVEIFRAWLPFPEIHFPHLTHLFLVIRCGSNPEETTFLDTQLAIASFANSLQETLQYLSIHCIPEYDLPFVYDNLGYFMHLSSIEIALSEPSPTNDQSDQALLFLTRQKDTIRHFFLTACKFQTTQRLEADKPSWHRLALGKLESFTVSADLWTGNPYHVRTFLADHQSTLRSLEMTGLISPDEIDELLAIINHISTNSILTKLSISIFRLDAAFLIKIMRWLPALKTLKLKIVKAASGVSSLFVPGRFFPLYLAPHENVHEFVTELMSFQELKAWKLTDITIQRKSCCRDLTLWSLMQLTATCIPSVTSFAENGHTDIPDSLNAKLDLGNDECYGCGTECTYAMDGMDSSR